MNVKIEHIDDVLPHIEIGNGFVVSKRDGYSIIDYAYSREGLFSNDVALQCRGLKFDAEGRLVGRPFHKFFNIGEKEQPDEIDWDEPHLVLAKLDGSMIHPVRLNGELVFMTRMGRTPQAQMAQMQAPAEVLALSSYCLDAALTPIFEFTSPENRIVVAYDTAETTLLAVREIVSGRYLNRTELEAIAQRFGVPLVPAHGVVDDYASFIDHSRALEGIEGFVVAFETGHRLKLKTDGYALRHNALSTISSEKNVLELIVENALDDVIPLVAPGTAERLRLYETQVQNGLARIERDIRDFVSAHEGLDRRAYAALIQRELDPRLAPAAFALLDSRPPGEFLVKALKRAAVSQPRVDAIRNLFGFEWTLHNADGFGGG